VYYNAIPGFDGLFINAKGVPNDDEFLMSSSDPENLGACQRTPDRKRLGVSPSIAAVVALSGLPPTVEPDQVWNGTLYGG
jgi:hypothetical protein